jgi:hypothetical protein
MTFSPRLGSSLAALVLAAACNRPPHAPLATAPSSTGLPPLSNVDAAAVIETPDTAVPVPPDTAPDLAPDTKAPPRDAAVDAAVPLDAAAGEVQGVAPAEDAQVCSSTSATAKPVPVDIFVLLDRSGSMTTTVPGLQRDGGFSYVSRWDSVKEALTNFVSSPAAAGLQVGLGFFPPPNTFSECNIADYATPAVPIAVLPGVAQSFITAMTMTYPDGGTPMMPALQGAVQYAKQREMMTGRRAAIALATDGDPGGCNSTVASVSQVATMAANDGIYTFVIGVGSSLTSFSTIAMAGGTKTAFLVENATPTELAMAFKNVQSQAARLACSFMVPPPPPGEMLDPYKVAVRFTPTMTPTQAFGIAMVASRADCGPMGGWYFDDLVAPTTLNLCDTSCQKVNGAGEGAVSLQFGCVAK